MNRDKVREKLKQSIAIFVILSLFIHIATVLFLTVTHKQPPVTVSRQVEVDFIAPPPPAEKKVDQAQKKLPKQKVTNITDQIVEQKDRINEEVDDKTRFLSAHNQKVLKQTRAEESGKFNNTAKGGHKDEGEKSEKKPEEQKVVEEKEKPEEPLDPGDMPKLKDLSPKFSMDPGPKGDLSKDNGDPSRSDDYLKDVNTGMQTLLSTREFVYYSYYARIKESIRQHWEPDVREKVKIIYRQGRTIASAKDRVTQVLVVLNGKGELIRVEVLGQSGVDTLDNAAVEAFKAASPFPNPPKGMIEADGTIKIRWDFVLEV